MKMSDYAGSRYIKIDDVRAGPRVETIESIEIGGYDRPEVTFQGGDILSLNKTNTRKLIANYGDDSRDWIGCTIELRIGTIPFKGQDTEVILVRPVSPPRSDNPRTAKPEPPATNARRDDMDDEIPF